MGSVLRCFRSFTGSHRLPWLRGKESTCNTGDTGDMSSIPGLGRFLRGGHSNPLQYSSLENLMNRGAWQAAVHGVSKSRTLLKQLPTHTRTRESVLGHPRLCRRLLWVLKFWKGGGVWPGGGPSSWSLWVGPHGVRLGLAPGSPPHLQLLSDFQCLSPWAPPAVWAPTPLFLLAERVSTAAFGSVD